MSKFLYSKFDFRRFALGLFCFLGLPFLISLCYGYLFEVHSWGVQICDICGLHSVRENWYGIESRRLSDVQETPGTVANVVGAHVCNWVGVTAFNANIFGQQGGKCSRCKGVSVEQFFNDVENSLLPIEERNFLFLWCRDAHWFAREQLQRSFFRVSQCSNRRTQGIAFKEILREGSEFHELMIRIQKNPERF